MKIRISLFLTFLPLLCISQHLSFEYDNAGNQVKREITFTAGKSGKPIGKKDSQFTDQEFLKFIPQENLSYYPNPVSEDLYLRWDSNEGNRVVKIELSSANGQALRSDDSVAPGSHTVSFGEFSAGIYFVKLYYSNGDTKTIKIIKK